MAVIQNVIVIGLVVVLVLLAQQAEPVTAAFGYGYAVLMFLALIASFWKGKK